MFTQSTGELRLSRISKAAPIAVLFLSVFTGYAQVDTSTVAASVRDPGVRGGPDGAGGPISNNSTEFAMFSQGLAAFQEVDGVSDGLGPRFNLDRCSGCHAQPAIGGSSPSVNPQVAFANRANQVPSFITSDGPVREARFKSDGGVHALFTITGRTGAGLCNLAQPGFDAALRQGNVIFRIPTPVFGAGLIESITDSAILANKAAGSNAKGQFGISGRENREGNTGTITRFGWKAQNKSLVVFSGEAYNVEQGVTNELFPQERDETPGCLLIGTPEDRTQSPTEGSDVIEFSNFMRLLAPPAPVASYGNVSATSVANGKALFTSGNIGCNLCHTPSLQTGRASSPALSGKTVNLYSDLLLHNMGSGLADGISQGSATGNEFRTAPLWGVGQRIFFLHDGRTKDLMDAIQEHSSNGSEANRSVAAFNALPAARQQDILNFLRSL
jgi:CxxC motif-containing protein (DUF1111 family)